MGNRTYYSTDRDAPVLTGQTSKLLDLLTSVLVEGFPTATVTSLTRVGTTATVDCSAAHGLKVGQEFTITGATDAAWNGTYAVATVPDADTFTYTLTTTPTLTSATGTIKVGAEKTVGTPSSITRSGSTVTVNLTGHGFAVANRFRIEGANETDYNGVWRVATVPDANSFTFDIGTATPATPATGTLLVRYGQAGAGWTKPYTGTNKAAFRQGGGNQYYVRIDDSNPSSVARAYAGGYRTMSDVDTGTDQFPSNNTIACWAKSNTTDATARKWMIFASEKLFHLLTQTGESPTNGTTAYSWAWFGDFKSFNTSAIYDCALSGRMYSLTSGGQAGNASVSYEYGNFIDQYSTSTRSSYPSRAAGTHNTVGDTYIGRFSNAWPTQSSGVGTHQTGTQGTLLYPNAVGNSLVMFPMYFYQASPQPNAIRGALPGAWVPCHTNPANNEDTFSGSGALNGRSFIVLRMATGTMCFETSDTWDD